MNRPKSKKHTRTRRGTRIFPSMANAAASLKISPETLKLAKRAGCPAFSARGSVDEKMFLEWIKTNPEFARGTISTKGLIDLELLRKHRRLNDIADAKLISRDLVASAVSQIFIAARGILRQRLEMEFPSTCVGLDMNGLRARGKQLHDDVVAELRKLSEMWPEGA